MQWTHLGNIHSPDESIVVTMFLHKFTTWWWLKRCCHLSSIILPGKVLSVGFKFCLCHDNKIGLSIFPSSECQSVKSLVETNTQPVNTTHRVHVNTHWRQNYHPYKDHALQIVGSGVSGQLSTFFVCRENLVTLSAQILCRIFHCWNASRDDRNLWQVLCGFG